jgi:uncharacterized protein YecA (UPF0149 family)
MTQKQNPEHDQSPVPEEADGHVHGPGCSHGHHHHHHEPIQPFVRATAKVGRNDPCPCGSQQKYKKCCGKSM